MAVTGDYILDFSTVPNTSPYSHPDFTRITNNAGTAEVIGGLLKPRWAGAKFVLRYNGGVTDTIITEITVSHSSSSFSDYTGLVAVDALGDGYLMVMKGNAVQLQQITGGGTAAPLSNADYSTRTYAAGARFTFEYTKSTGSLVSKLDGVVVATRTDTTHGAKDLKPGVFIVGGDSGSQGIYEIGITGTALPASITDVNGGVAVTQYQQSVSTTLENMDANDVTAVTFNGNAVSYTAASSTSLPWHAPGNMTTGTYTLEISTATETIAADVDYTRTHPIQVPPAGTAVDPDSIFGQMGNPGGRYISVTKPAELTWKAPHDSFTAANCALDISDLLEAPSDAPADQSYDITGSLIDPDGVTQAFTIAATVDLAEEPVDPPPPMGEDSTPGWVDIRRKFGKGIRTILEPLWDLGDKHPKTNARPRMWKKER